MALQALTLELEATASNSKFQCRVQSCAMSPASTASVRNFSQCSVAVAASEAAKRSGQLEAYQLTLPCDNSHFFGSSASRTNLLKRALWAEMVTSMILRAVHCAHSVQDAHKLPHDQMNVAIYRKLTPVLGVHVARQRRRNGSRSRGVCRLNCCHTLDGAIIVVFLA